MGWAPKSRLLTSRLSLRVPLPPCSADDFRVLGPAHPVLARVGEDALLTCGLVPRRAAAHMEVRWFRWGPSERVLSARRDGAEVPGVQTEDYRGRVEWAEDGLAEGRVALKLRGVRPSDAGRYWCRFQDGSSCAESSLLLQVAGECRGDLGSRREKAAKGGGSLRVKNPFVRGRFLSRSSPDSLEGEWAAVSGAARRSRDPRFSCRGSDHS